MNTISEQEARELVGMDTVLGFQLSADGIINYKTLIPIIPKDLFNEDLYYYEVSLFTNDDIPDFFNFDSFSNFLGKFQIYILNKVNDSGDTVEEIYHCKYDENYKP